MKTTKLKYARLNELKDLIDRFQIKSYSVSSDEGRSLIISVDSAIESISHEDYYDVILDFHIACFSGAGGMLRFKKIGTQLQADWIESRDLILDGESEKILSLCNMILPGTSSVEMENGFYLIFHFSGQLNRKLSFSKFVFMCVSNEVPSGSKDIKAFKKLMSLTTENKLEKRWSQLLIGYFNELDIKKCSFEFRGNESEVFEASIRLETESIVISE